MNDIGESSTTQTVPRSSDLGRPMRGGGLMSHPAWAISAAFGAYFCMYAFRKPFNAGSFTDETLLGMGYKDVLVIAQVLGYTLSKFLGIKIVSEAAPSQRGILLLALVGVSELALLFFAITPPPYNFIWLFLNGLPLGMVFGLVVGFLEGRQKTEMLAAGLCASFIVADGVMKSVGAWLLKQEMSEYWMPFVAGLMFAGPLCLFVWMLMQIPAPSADDVSARSERVPMAAADRRGFYRTYGLGLTLLLVVFALITILRSVRGDYSPQLWKELGGARDDEGVYARSELLVCFGVVVLCGALVFIRDNRRAFFAALGLAIGGTLLIALALLGLHMDQLSPFLFLVLLGLGLYLPYFVVHITIFERMIAMTRNRANIGYLITLADAFGYLSYVGLLALRNFVPLTPNAPESTPRTLEFFVVLSWWIAALCLGLLVLGWCYFAIHPATRREARAAPEPIV